MNCVTCSQQYCFSTAGYQAVLPGGTVFIISGAEGQLAAVGASCSKKMWRWEVYPESVTAVCALFILSLECSHKSHITSLLTRFCSTASAWEICEVSGVASSAFLWMLMNIALLLWHEDKKVVKNCRCTHLRKKERNKRTPTVAKLQVSLKVQCVHLF